jgi:putative transposase
VNEHNGWVLRDSRLEDWEKQTIIGFHLKNPLEGYRRLTFMMLDADIVAVSSTSVWRVLGQAELLSKCNCKPSKKGRGFEQPLAVHQHWHNGRVVHQHQRDLLLPVQRSGRLQPLHRELRSAGVYDRGGHRGHLEPPRNFIRASSPIARRSSLPKTSSNSFGSRHVPRQNFALLSQSNGKIERWHKSLKGEWIRPRTPLSLDDARRLVVGYVEHYSNVRLNSAIGYLTPMDMLSGRQQEIHAERDRKL